MRFFKFVILLLLGLAVIAAGITYHYYQAPNALTEAKVVLIERGKGFRATVETLAGEGVIDHPLLFSAIAVATGNARKFKAGEYQFPPESSPEAVMHILAEGKVVVHKLTVPEGLTSREILAILNAETILSGTVTAPVEDGSLLPETYYFIYGDSRQELVDRMKTSAASLLAELWPKRKANLPLETPAQALVLASIVEKETGVDGERGRVAAVFVNRLRKGMKLQSDPTVIYAIEKDSGSLGRELLTKDLSYDSPYNTYAVAGLPPGPICNPGRAAIEAVLNPPDTNDLYFVATGQGGHHFAANLREHNRNVQEYRRQLRQAKP